jgi:hypothetical protein
MLSNRNQIINIVNVVQASLAVVTVTLTMGLTSCSFMQRHDSWRNSCFSSFSTAAAAVRVKAVSARTPRRIVLVSSAGAGRAPRRTNGSRRRHQDKQRRITVTDITCMAPSSGPFCATAHDRLPPTTSRQAKTNHGDRHYMHGAERGPISCDIAPCHTPHGDEGCHGGGYGVGRPDLGAGFLSRVPIFIRVHVGHTR